MRRLHFCYRFNPCNQTAIPHVLAGGSRNKTEKRVISAAGVVTLGALLSDQALAVPDQPKAWEKCAGIVLRGHVGGLHPKPPGPAHTAREYKLLYAGRTAAGEIPWSRVEQIHVAGCADQGGWLLDTHQGTQQPPRDGPVGSMGAEGSAVCVNRPSTHRSVTYSRWVHPTWSQATLGTRKRLYQTE